MRKRWADTVREIDRGDVLIVIGLGFVTAGLWAVVHAAALTAPGVVLLWIGLPSRTAPFIATGTVVESKRKGA